MIVSLDQVELVINKLLMAILEVVTFKILSEVFSNYRSSIVSPSESTITTLERCLIPLSS